MNIVNSGIGDQADVKRSERRWVIGFALVVLLVTTIPYLIGYGAQSDGYQFTGFVFGVSDGNSYIAKMLRGTYGAWVFRSPYTAYPQSGSLLFLPYLLLGKLAWPPGTHEQLVALYHLFRIVAGFFAILATYDFLSYFLAGRFVRRFGLVLAILGGGMGWILVIYGSTHWLGSLPLEFYSPESFGFLGLFGIPHLALARALMLYVILALMKSGGDRGKMGRTEILKAVRTGWLWLLAGVAQPLIAPMIGILFLWYLAGQTIRLNLDKSKGIIPEWDKLHRMVLYTIVSGILPGIYILYNFLGVIFDPFLASWNFQNLTPSPHPAHYFLAYGVMLPYLWIGGKRLLQADPWKGWLPVGWVLLLPALAYAPLGLQRRLPEGIWVAMVVVGMASLNGIFNRRDTPTKKVRIAALLPLILLFPSTIILLVGGILAARNVQKPIYRPVDEVNVFLFLEENAVPGEVVMTSFDTGNPLPAWAPLTVVIGHGPESANLEKIRPQVASFYSTGASDKMRQYLVVEFDLDYVFLGPAESAMGDWNPQMASFLRLLYQSGDYSVYQVVQE